MPGYQTKFRKKVQRPHQIPRDTACADVPSPVSDTAFLGEFLNQQSDDRANPDSALSPVAGALNDVSLGSDERAAIWASTTRA